MLRLFTWCVLVLGLAASATSVQAQTQVLAAGWRLRSSQGLTETGEQISRLVDTNNGWMPAVVPGTVLTSYVKNGQYPDPFYDVNNKISQGLIPDASTPGSVFSQPYWYRTTFIDNRSDRAKILWLHLDGINYRANVFLNGHAVGRMNGMFKRGLFNVTTSAVSGQNCLAVRISPLDVPGVPTGIGCAGDGQIGRNAAAMVATVGWDFTLPDGVRDRNMGIYRRVYLTRTGPVAIRDPFMVTDRLATKPAASAGLTFKMTLVNAADKVVQGTLKLSVQGAAGAAKALTLLPNETREIVFTGLTVPRPRLWWPVGQGGQNLYALRVSFSTPDGQASDTVRTRFGIRTIRQDTSFHGQNTFWVNGRRVFIQGGNWVQDATVCATRREYDFKLRQIAQAGVNMLRCWSGSAPESDDFYDLCDTLGIMVWTESGAAAQVRAPDDHALQLDNWADVVLRIRNHPCQAYYCGCNEGFPVAGTGDVVAKYDGTRQYQDSSQQNGQRGAPYRWQGINTLYDYTDRDAYGAGPLGPFAGFCNETGCPVLPPAEVLRAQIRPGKLWPTVGHPAFDEAIDYHDGGGFHLMRRFINEGCAQYGDFVAPDLAGRTGVDNYGFKGQILGAAEYRAFSEVWKRNKWDEAHKRYDSGYMFWTINNPNPMVAARIANYSGEPNAALFYFAHGNKSLHAQFDYFYNDITVVNDRAMPIPNLNVRAEILNLDGSAQWQAEKRVDVAADQSRTGVLAIPPKNMPGLDDVHFVNVELRDASGKLVDRALYWRARNDPKYGADGPFTALNQMPLARLTVKPSLKKQGVRRRVTVKLTNPTSHLAFFTRLKVYRRAAHTLVQPCAYEDNYFSLLPHETRTVALDYAQDDLRGDKPLLIVEGWNIKSMALPLSDPVIAPQANLSKTR